ncbi:MAG: rod shape-determining protein MreC [Candidatus Omnitrophica bacterium]|nr:rod shape-determining protein MreC [Candidatus Omnitrophota bacterium]
MLARKKNSAILFSAAAVAILASIFIPLFRVNLLDSLRCPLKVFSFLSREIEKIVSYHKISIQNQQLKKQIGLGRRQIHESSELYLENIRIRQLLDFKQMSVYPLTAASVIAYDPSNLSSIIIIDKGRREGIIRDCAVITNDGLVGRIIEAGNSTSKVLLINDLNSGVAAFIQRSRSQGLASGSLGGGIMLRYLSPEADVQISDLVVTSGLGGLYPKGILIGEISGIRQEDNRPEKIALLEPSVNLNKLEEVLVVLKE